VVQRNIEKLACCAKTFLATFQVFEPSFSFYGMPFAEHEMPE
jgi:hypothetical protein